MSKLFRFSASRLALVYIALGVLALALFAIPLWYGWRANISTFRAYVQGGESEKLVEVFRRAGPQQLAATHDITFGPLEDTLLSLGTGGAFCSAHGRRLS